MVFTKNPPDGHFFKQNAEMKHANERRVSHFSVIRQGRVTMKCNVPQYIGHYNFRPSVGDEATSSSVLREMKVGAQKLYNSKLIVL